MTKEKMMELQLKEKRLIEEKNDITSILLNSLIQLVMVNDIALHELQNDFTKLPDIFPSIKNDIKDMNTFNSIITKYNNQVKKSKEAISDVIKFMNTRQSNFNDLEALAKEIESELRK